MLFTDAEVAAANNQVGVVTRYLTVGNGDINEVSPQTGNTLLATAAAQGSLEVLAYLLDHSEIKVLTYNHANATPLALALDTLQIDAATLIAGKMVDRYVAGEYFSRYEANNYEMRLRGLRHEIDSTALETHFIGKQVKYLNDYLAGKYDSPARTIQHYQLGLAEEAAAVFSANREMAQREVMAEFGPDAGDYEQRVEARQQAFRETLQALLRRMQIPRPEEGEAGRLFWDKESLHQRLQAYQQLLEANQEHTFQLFAEREDLSSEAREVFENSRQTSAELKIEIAAIFKAAKAARLRDVGDAEQLRAELEERQHHRGYQAISLVALTVLLRSGYPVDRPDIYGDTLLHAMANYRKQEQVSLLVNAPWRASLTLGNDRGQTPRDMAFIDRATRKILFDAHYVYQAFAAVRAGDYKLLQDAIDKKIDIDVVDDRRNSLVHIAAKGRHYGLLQLLLQQGADRAKYNDVHQTPLEYSGYEDDPQLIELLAVPPYRDAAFAAVFLGDLTRLQEILQQIPRLDIDVRDDFGCTLLFRAVEKNRGSIIQFLLDANASISVRNYQGENVADIVCRIKTPHYELLQRAVHKARLLTAVKRDQLAMVQDSLAAYPDLVNTQDRSGTSLLHHSITHQCSAITTLLLDHGAEYTTVNCFQETPMHAALLADDDATVNELVKRWQTEIIAQLKKYQAPGTKNRDRSKIFQRLQRLFMLQRDIDNNQLHNMGTVSLFESVSFNGIDLQKNTVFFLFQLLATTPCIRRLDFSLQRVLAKVPVLQKLVDLVATTQGQIQALDLSHIGLSGSHVDAITNLIQQGRLERVNLGYNLLTDDAVQRILTVYTNDAIAPIDWVFHYNLQLNWQILHRAAQLTRSKRQSTRISVSQLQQFIRAWCERESAPLWHLDEEEALAMSPLSERSEAPSEAMLSPARVMDALDEDFTVPGEDDTAVVLVPMAEMMLDSGESSSPATGSMPSLVDADLLAPDTRAWLDFIQVDFQPVVEQESSPTDARLDEVELSRAEDDAVAVRAAAASEFVEILLDDGPVALSLPPAEPLTLPPTSDRRQEALAEQLRRHLPATTVVVPPQLFAVNSPLSGEPEVARRGAITLVKYLRGAVMQNSAGELLGQTPGIFSPEQVLDRPIVVPLPQLSAREAARPAHRQHRHWSVLVILPAYYQPPEGDALSNAYPRQFYIDSRDLQATIPPVLQQVLKHGAMQSIGDGELSQQEQIARLYPEVEVWQNPEGTQQVEAMRDDPWWVIYNAFMVTLTGRTDHIEDQSDAQQLRIGAALRELFPLPMAYHRPRSLPPQAEPVAEAVQADDAKRLMPDFIARWRALADKLSGYAFPLDGRVDNSTPRLAAIQFLVVKLLHKLEELEQGMQANETSLTAVQQLQQLNQLSDYFERLCQAAWLRRYQPYQHTLVTDLYDALRMAQTAAVEYVPNRTAVLQPADDVMQTAATAFVARFTATFRTLTTTLQSIRDAGYDVSQASSRAFKPSSIGSLFQKPWASNQDRILYGLVDSQRYPLNQSNAVAIVPFAVEMLRPLADTLPNESEQQTLYVLLNNFNVTLARVMAALTYHLEHHRHNVNCFIEQLAVHLAATYGESLGLLKLPSIHKLADFMVYHIADMCAVLGAQLPAYLQRNESDVLVRLMTNWLNYYRSRRPAMLETRLGETVDSYTLLQSSGLLFQNGHGETIRVNQALPTQPISQGGHWGCRIGQDWELAQARELLTATVATEPPQLDYVHSQPHDAAAQRLALPDLATVCPGQGYQPHYAIAVEEPAVLRVRVAGRG